MLQTINNWFSESYIELIGVITGIAYILFSIKRNILLWPVGILTSGFYIAVFLISKLYADMSLQVYYLIISIYGWVIWKKPVENIDLNVVSIKKQQLAYIFISIGVLFVFISFILKKYTDSPVPYLDALTTAGGIVGTWMITKKYLENWILWIIINIISIGIYTQRELYMTVVLYTVYTIMSVAGYREWKKYLKLENA